MVFYKMFYKSHINAGKMKILKMTKKHFQWAIYRKESVCVTLYILIKISICLIFVKLENTGQIKGTLD